MNVYKDHQDDTIKNMIDSAIGKLKKGAGQPLPRGTDHSAPPLDYGPGTPAKINKTSVWPKKIHIDLPS
jgi:hypothetical protein